MTGQSGSFSLALRHHRVTAGLSQEALAERAGISVRGVSDLERGLSRAPRLHTLVRLSEALGLDDAARQTLSAAAGYPGMADEPTGPPSAVVQAPARRPLPGYLTELVERDQEIGALGHLLRQAEERLLTLTGPAGVGKTRLAVQAAADYAARYPDDQVVFVPLAPLRDATLIPAAIAQAVGIPDPGGGSSLDDVASVLQDQRLLLVLDNFEHLLGGAHLVVDLLVRFPGVRVLATSRRMLRVHGEQTFLVQPLHVPLALQATPETAAAWPALVLFVQRARAAQPAFELTSENVGTIQAICQRLDGLPLALELAAARLAVLTPAALLTRLQQRIPVLTRGPRDAPTRQRALRDAIAWSHDLLAEDEQRLFRRLSVFAGGWTLAAAEQVCVLRPDQANAQAERNRDAQSVLKSLAVLVEHSLVQSMDDAVAEPRFAMLETIREFALDQLEASGEAHCVRERHAAALA
jgi:predicted ATPase/DNA-binding XRE family transcriptional regulator